MYEEQFMAAAVAEADINLTSNEGGPFGAVVVKNGKIVGKGHNRVIAKHDPTAHGEMEAIRDACKNLGTHDLTGCELFTSCYPCPMCLGGTIWSNIKTIYYGNTQKDADAIGFRDDVIYEFIQTGCKNDSFLKLEQQGREQSITTFQKFAAKSDKQMY